MGLPAAHASVYRPHFSRAEVGKSENNEALCSTISFPFSYRRCVMSSSTRFVSRFFVLSRHVAARDYEALEFAVLDHLMG